MCSVELYLLMIEFCWGHSLIGVASEEGLLESLLMGFLCAILLLSSLTSLIPMFSLLILLLRGDSLIFCVFGEPIRGIV